MRQDMTRRNRWKPMAAGLLIAVLACLFSADDAKAQDAQQSDTVVEAIMEAAKSGDAWVRKGMIEVLGRSVNERPAVVELLVDATEDADSQVRYMALQQLLKVNNASPELVAVIVKRGIEFGERSAGRGGNAISRYGELAVPHLIDVLKSDAETSDKYNACDALSNIGSAAKPAIAELLILVRNEKENKEVRIKAASAATMIAQAADVAAQDKPAGATADNRQLRYAEALVARHDSDSDGKLAKSEWPQTKLFYVEAADVNQDGFLTVEEIAAQIRER